jgi:hypothetical protein
VEAGGLKPNLVVVDPFDDELQAFINTDWGRATATPADAAGLCKRATLVLLARLEAAGLAGDVELWNLIGAVEGKGRGPGGYGEHWVLVRRGQVIDVSARQFDPNATQPRRVPVQDEFDRWQTKTSIDPDAEDMWDGGFYRWREIPPYWRDLVDVGPPGDLPDWPYPRHLLDPGSNWYVPREE